MFKNSPLDLYELADATPHLLLRLVASNLLKYLFALPRIVEDGRRGRSSLAIPSAVRRIAIAKPASTRLNEKGVETSVDTWYDWFSNTIGSPTRVASIARYAVALLFGLCHFVERTQVRVTAIESANRTSKLLRSFACPAPCPSRFVFFQKLSLSVSGARLTLLPRDFTFAGCAQLAFLFYWHD